MPNISLQDKYFVTLRDPVAVINRDGTNIHLYEYNNENNYELLWATRLQIYNQYLDYDFSDLFEFFNAIDDFENQFRMTYEIVLDKNNNKRYLSGFVNLRRRTDPLKNGVSGFEDRLKKVTSRFNSDIDTIIEIGSGYSRQIFQVLHHLDFPEVRCVSAEFTESGRELAAKIKNKFFKNYSIDFAFTDHKSADFPYIGPEENTLLFSCHSLEQVPSLPLDFFVKLSECSKSLTGIHLEPFGFQAVPDLSKNKTQRDHENFARAQNYNLNFMDCIQYAVEKKVIDVVEQEIDFSYDQPENPTSYSLLGETVKGT